MANVRGIGGVQPADTTTSTTVHRVRQPKKTEAVIDKVEISKTSMKAAEVATFTEIAKASPDIRPDVVEEAKRRLESGFYLGDQVTDTVARKILDSLL